MDPVGCAVSAAVLRIYHRENLLEKCRVVGAYLRQKLLKLKERYSIIGAVLGHGLALGVKVVERKEVSLSRWRIISRVMAENDACHLMI